MKLSEHWLRTWVNPAVTTAELVNQLTMAGLEVDSVVSVAPPFTHVVVGEVLTIAPHPDAENLTVCQVNVGNNTPLTIVCGARNVQAGMRVPTALVGANLPGHLIIQETTLRGVLSQGMLCSARELGLSETAEGILPLPKEAPLGVNIRDYLDLDDVSIEIDLTPNRGDCLSVAGIAREIGLLNRCTVISPVYPSIPVTIPDTFPVSIENPEACPRYVGRVIKNVNARAQTPLWMQERLRRSGTRCISALVDVTNYVLLELGQPLHVFDLAHLTGGIHVRLAQTGESLALLDGQTVALDSQTLVIADDRQPQAMAGIMGGLASAVSDTTCDVFLESAFFAPPQHAGSARRYGLQTESSYRFERGVDSQLQRRAAERATALLSGITGGQAGPLIEIAHPETLPVIPTITLRANRIERLFGQALAADEVNDILQRLGMTVRQDSDTWQVCPPSFRFDIGLETDLIEELARVHGYNNLPSRVPSIPLTMSTQMAPVRRVQNVLVQRGYQEAITYSFVDPQLQVQLEPTAQLLTLVNPLSSDMAVMRTTLWAGLLPAVAYNHKRQQTRVRLFETGLRFQQTATGLQQESMVAGVATGTRYPEQWGQSVHPIDFFDVKADIENLLKLAGSPHRFEASTHPALHSGQTAAIYQGDEWLGIIGALHPSLVATLELLPPVYVFELRLAPLLQTRLPQATDISKYPSIRRDIAIIAAETVRAETVLACINQIASELLVDLQVFDVYRGQGIDMGKKSLAIGLIFQAFSRNLVESEVDTLMTQIIKQLEQHLDAQLRK